MKGLGTAIALALLAGCGGRSEQSFSDVEINIAAPTAIAVQEYHSPPAPACAPDLEGRFSQSGNRWGRDGALCIDRVLVTFYAFPDPSLHYVINSDRCPDVRNFGRFRQPADFFHRAVPEQISLLKAAMADDLPEFARLCGIQLDPAPFVDGRFDRFYLDYGDGWWFDRINGGIRLTPNVRSDETRTVSH